MAHRKLFGALIWFYLFFWTQSVQAVQPDSTRSGIANDTTNVQSMQQQIPHSLQARGRRPPTPTLFDTVREGYEKQFGPQGEKYRPYTYLLAVILERSELIYPPEKFNGPATGYMADIRRFDQITLKSLTISPRTGQQQLFTYTSVGWRVWHGVRTKEHVTERTEHNYRGLRTFDWTRLHNIKGIEAADSAIREAGNDILTPPQRDAVWRSIWIVHPQELYTGIGLHNLVYRFEAFDERGSVMLQLGSEVDAQNLNVRPLQKLHYNGMHPMDLPPKKRPRLGNS